MNGFWLMLFSTLLKCLHQTEILSQLNNKSTTLQEGPKSCLYIF